MRISTEIQSTTLEPVFYSSDYILEDENSEEENIEETNITTENNEKAENKIAPFWQKVIADLISFQPQNSGNSGNFFVK